MTAWRMLHRAVLAAGASWLCGCANQSASLHDLATEAMIGSAKAPAQETSDSATRARATAAKPYTSADQRWSVLHPADWKTEGGARFVKISKGQAVVGVHSFVHVAGDSLDEAADATVREWERQMQGVNIVKRVSRHRVTLSGDLTAIEIVHHIGTGRVGQSRKVIVVVRDRRFLLDAETHLASWPVHEADFNLVIGSFKVLD